MMPCKGKEFLQDFVKRTKENYENAGEEYKITQLINSTVGLLLVPKERAFVRIDDSDVPADLLNRLLSQPQLIKYTYREALNLKALVKHLRNAIAHGRFECMSDDPYIGEGHPIITHIQFKDRNEFGRRSEEFEILIPVADLKELMFAFSDAMAKKAAI